MKEVDEEQVNRIVEKMKEKYKEQGIDFSEDIDSDLGKIRGYISEDAYSTIDLESEEDVEYFNSPLTQTLGKVYLKLKNILEPLKNNLKELSVSKEIGFYLYSANMHYSPNQFVAISSAAGFLATLITFIIGLFLGITSNNLLIGISLTTIIPVFVGIIVTIGILFIPKQKAIARGNACSVELPFALRHMSTELKAGIGLYKTIQTIAVNDYEVLGEEFAKTIAEIEEGTDTSIALKHLSIRTQSLPLKQTINHILRVMRIGGNLSNIMSEIAEDVSEEMQNKINIFSQKMNFFSVIFIFAGIVLPVAVMILGTIRNSSIMSAGKDLFKSVPLTPGIMAIIYLLILPLIFGGMIYIIYSAQPRLG